MKKLYTSPLSSQINIDFEGVIAASGESGIMLDNESTSEAGTILSEEKDMWGNGDIWN